MAGFSCWPTKRNTCLPPEDLKLKGRPDPTKTTQTRPTNEFRRTPFSFEEYKKFVRPRATDFLHNLVLPFDDRAYRSRLETDSNASARLLAMSTNFSVDSLALSNVASNAEKFKKGLFSFDLSAISDVLEEEEEEEEGNRMGKKNGVMQKQSVPSIVEPQEESAEVAQPTNISAAIQNRQDRLDAIWKKLQMPMEQRLAMLTKYSVGTYAKKLKNSLSLWEDAAYLIGHREALLPQLLELEINQCDPEYAVVSDSGDCVLPADYLVLSSRYRNDSKSREAENDKRASMLARLKKQTDRLQRVLNSIKSHFDDVVCYQGKCDQQRKLSSLLIVSQKYNTGTPYAEKMIHDYSNIQYRAVEEYKRRVRLPPINNVQKQ